MRYLSILQQRILFPHENNYCFITEELPVGLLYNPESTLGTRYISAAGTAIT